MPQTAPPNTRWIVLKFGGTSVSKRDRWDTIGRLAAERMRLHDSRALVVVSALAGVTNALQEIADGVEDPPARLEVLARRHREFAVELGLDPGEVLGERLAALLALGGDARAVDRPLDWQAEVLAQGELLSSTLGAAYLGAQGLAPGWLDARDWLQAQALPNQGEWVGRMAATVPGVKAISRRDGVVLVSMETIGMWQQVGFLADIFECFRRHGLSVDLIGSSETNVTVSLDPSENLVSTDVLSRLSDDLARSCRLKVIAPCTAITLVGRGMRSLLHRLSDVWATFGRERVHLVSQSSNDLNLTFVIDEADAEGLLQELHDELIESGAMPVREPGVFGPRWREIEGGTRRRPAPWWQARRAELLALAARGTPRYAYDPGTVRARARQLAGVRAVDRRFYAIKANPHPELLRLLVDEGFGLECVSAGELAHVFSVLPGLDPGRVLFTPSFAPIAEYADAFARGVTVTLDNVEALQRWPEVFGNRALWLRIDLGRGDGHHAKVVTGGPASKFGLQVDRIDAFLAAARAIGARVTGLHAHLGSGVDTPDHWREVCDELCGIAEGMGGIDTIDIGGGLPIPYREDDEPFDIAAWSAGLDEVKAAHPGFRLAIEPGRFLVAESGVLLLTATQVVEKGGIHRVGTDAGMNALMRPTLYDAWHDVHNLSRTTDAGAIPFDVVGPICESGDVLGRQRPLPCDTAPGDVLLVADAGAYGMAMSNTYNLRALPDESLLLENKE